MKSKYFFLLVFSFAWSFISAQNKNTGYRFHSINNVGLLNGNNSVDASLQTINGFKNGSLFAGIGVGFDYYLYRTVPVFVDLRYEFGKNKNKFFVYADGGINFEWVKADMYQPPSTWNNNRSNDFHNGLYTDAGFGYLVGKKNGGAFLLSLGHSVKTMKGTYTYRDWRTLEWQTGINRYRLNRIILKAGWRF